MKENPNFKENPEGLPEIEFGEEFSPFEQGVVRTDSRSSSSPDYYLKGVGKMRVTLTDMVSEGQASIEVQNHIVFEKNKQISVEKIHPWLHDLAVEVDYEEPGKDPNFMCTITAGSTELSAKKRRYWQ